MNSGLLDSDPIVERLLSISQKSPDLEEGTRFYGAILPVLRAADIGAAKINLTRQQALKKMEMGLPLLHGLDLGVDAHKVFDLMIVLTRTIERDDRPAVSGSQTDCLCALSEKARCIRVAMEEGKINEDSLVSGDLGSNGQRSNEGVDPDFLRTLVRYAMKPAFKDWRRQSIQLTEVIEWHKEYCPVCGSLATLGELQGGEQAKHLRCSRCGADWPSRRVECIYCGNEDHKRLGYLYVEGGSGGGRIEVCELCRGYLKVIPAFSPAPDEFLTVEDFATIHLDYIAQSRGYWRMPDR